MWGCLFVCLSVQYDCRQCYIPCMAGAVVCWWVTMATGELYLEYSPFCLQYSDVVQSHCFVADVFFCTYHSGIRTVSDLSCIRSIWAKGQVATHMSSVELFAIRMKIFDGQKMCLITWSFPSETFDWLIFNRPEVKLQPFVLAWSILSTIWRLPWFLDQLSKMWFNFDSSRKHFYMRHMTTLALRVFINSWHRSCYSA